MARPGEIDWSLFTPIEETPSVDWSQFTPLDDEPSAVLADYGLQEDDEPERQASVANPFGIDVSTLGGDLTAMRGEAERSASDTGVALRQGGAGLLRTGANLAEQAAGVVGPAAAIIADPVGTVLSGGRNVRESVEGAQAGFQGAADELGDLSRAYGDELSPEAQAQDQDMAAAYERGLLSGLGYQLRNPTTILRQLAQSAPGTLTAILAGRGGVVPLAAATAGMGAGEAASGATDAVMALPPETIVQVPRYQELLAESGDPMTARRQLAAEAADEAQALGAAAGAIGAVPGLNPVETMLSRQAAAQAGRGIASRIAGSRAGRAGLEAIGEVPEEVGINLAASAGQQAVGLDVDPTEGLAQTIGSSLLVGGTMGAMTPGPSAETILREGQSEADGGAVVDAMMEEEAAAQAASAPAVSPADVMPVPHVDAELDTLLGAPYAPEAVADPIPVEQPTVEAEPDVSSESPRFARQRTPILGDTPELAAWTALAQHDDAFQTPVSRQRSPEGIFADTAPGFELQRADELAQQNEYGATRAWRIRTPQNVPATIYEDPKGQVWIDVSDLTSGDDGKRIYNAVANYAHNNGKVFVGDPAGLSDTAMFRRAENMLSSALKFRTTRHLYPHERQLQGNRRMRVPALNWKVGDDAHNIQELIRVTREATTANVPEMAGVRYNPRTARFERDGQEVTDADFNRIARAARKREERDALEARARFAASQGVRGDPLLAAGGGGGPALGSTSGVGRTTLKRAKFSSAFLPGEGEGRSGLLEELGRERLPRPLKDILYSRKAEQTPAPAGVRVSEPAFERVSERVQAMRSPAVASVVERAKTVSDRWQGNAPKLRVYASKSDLGGKLAESLRKAEERYGPQTVSAIYDDGEIHLVAEGLPDAKAVNRAIAHEVVHWAVKEKGLSDLLGQKESRGLERQLLRLAESDRAFRKARDEVAKEYGKEPDAVQAEEVLAHLAANYEGLTGRVKEWFDYVVGLLREAGQRFAGKAGSLSRTDVIDALRRARVMPRQKAAPAEPAPEAEPRFARRSLTPEQEAALTKAGLPIDRRSTVERAADLVKDQWQAIRDKLAEGANAQRVFDRFHRMRAIEQDLGIDPEQSAYISARLSTGLPSIMEAILKYGAPEWQNGVLGEKGGTKGLLDALKPVKDDIDDWLGWMVGRRAKVLKSQGREHLMSDENIEALLSLAKGKEQAFTEAARDYLRIKTAILDVAEKAGLIDPASRAAWDHAEYVPFYRVDDEMGTVGPGRRATLAGQTAGIRTLKGGQQVLADPLSNIIRNFTRLVDASLKNNAVLEAVDNYGDTFFEKVGMGGGFERIPLSEVKKHLLDQGVPQSMIDAMPQQALTGLTRMWAIKPPQDEDVIRVMRDGKPEYYRVPDPDLLRALTAFKQPERHWGVKPFVFFKRLLTGGVTASPEFMLRNFIRDSGSAWVIADDRFRLGMDSIRGVVSPMLNDTDKRAMMFAGGSFIGGYLYEGAADSTAKALRRALRDKGMSAKDIESFAKTVVHTPAKLWDAWQRIGSAIENANRNAVYDNAIKAGRSKKEAAFMAKDLMDFSMQGDSRFIQVFADVLPFFNARLQGNYKLYRQGGKEAVRNRMLWRMGLIAMASGALLAWNRMMYPDGYDKLEEWDKDAYWHIAPGTIYHTRIPKPFELGVISATVPERLMNAILYQVTDGEQGDRLDQLGGSMASQLLGTLAMNPIPHGVMPIIELWANKKSFTGRPIEDMGDQKLLPEARAEWYTSDSAKILSDVLGNQTGLSPKRIQHLWEGYTGTVGAYALDALDWVIRQSQDQPERPEMALAEMPLVKAIYRGGVEPRNTRQVTEFYELWDTLQQVSGTIKQYEVDGRSDDAEALEKKWAWLLGDRERSKRAKAGFMHAGYREFNRTADQLSRLRKEVNGLVTMPGMDGSEKKRIIEELLAERNQIASEIVSQYRRAARQ